MYPLIINNLMDLGECIVATDQYSNIYFKTGYIFFKTNKKLLVNLQREKKKFIKGKTRRMVSKKFVHALRIDVSRYLRSLLSSIRIFMVRKNIIFDDEFPFPRRNRDSRRINRRVG